MERFSEKAFIKAGVIDALKNKIFIKDGKQYVFNHWIYDKKIYVFAFASVTGENGWALQLYNQHYNDYKNTTKLLFSAFDEIRNA